MATRNSTKTPDRVRYVSPFGSPAYMPRDVAERYMADDDARWLRYLAAEQQGAGQMLTDQQRQIGPPRIEPLPR